MHQIFSVRLDILKDDVQEDIDQLPINYPFDLTLIRALTTTDTPSTATEYELKRAAKPTATADHNPHISSPLIDRHSHLRPYNYYSFAMGLMSWIASCILTGILFNVIVIAVGYSESHRQVAS